MFSLPMQFALLLAVTCSVDEYTSDGKYDKTYSDITEVSTNIPSQATKVHFTTTVKIHSFTRIAHT